MGRQIAQVMSHYGIDWLEREEREREENTSLLLKNLAVKPGMFIADICVFRTILTPHSGQADPLLLV